MSARASLLALLVSIAFFVLLIGCGGGGGATTGATTATTSTTATSSTATNTGSTASTNTGSTSTATTATTAGTDGSTSAATTGTAGVLPSNVILFNENDGTTNSILQMNPDGSGLTTFDTLPTDYVGYAHSPADSKVAFGYSGGQPSQFKLYVNSSVNVTGATLIDPGPYLGISYLQFTPDGSKIVYIAQDPALLDVRLCVANADGSGTPVVLDSAEGANLSPSGDVIVYSKLVGSNGVIFRRRLDGSGLVQVTHDSFDNISPSWSKEGDKIFFSSSRSGGYCIWSMDANGGNLTQLTIDGTLDLNPSPNSGATEIAFRRLSNNSALRGIYKIDAAGTTLTPLHLSPNVANYVYWTGVNGRAPGAASAPWSQPSPRIRKLIDKLTGRR